MGKPRGPLRKPRRCKHGGTPRGNKAPEYASWGNMLQRCENPNNPNFEHYGGRGIAVCPEWHDYPQFLADMGKKPSAAHTLERIDNNGNYEPGNCRWATQDEQCQNMRTCLYVTFDGRTQTVGRWAKETGFSASAISSRIRHGWSAEAALTVPVRKRSPNRFGPPKPPKDKTHCPQGHLFDEENTGRRRTANNWRYCKQCHRDRGRKAKPEEAERAEQDRQIEEQQEQEAAEEFARAGYEQAEREAWEGREWQHLASRSDGKSAEYQRRMQEDYPDF